jgi:hypothetical protein
MSGTIRTLLLVILGCLFVLVCVEWRKEVDEDDGRVPGKCSALSADLISQLLRSTPTITRVLAMWNVFLELSLPSFPVIR